MNIPEDVRAAAEAVIAGAMAKLDMKALERAKNHKKLIHDTYAEAIAHAILADRAGRQADTDDAGFLARKPFSERCGRWLPITIAPKDGTRIWIYYPTTAFKTGKPGLGTKTEDAISLVGYWREAPSHEGGGYWTTDYNGKEKRRARATYWQKLPDPPALDAAVRVSGS